MNQFFDVGRWLEFCHVIPSEALSIRLKFFLTSPTPYVPRLVRGIHCDANAVLQPLDTADKPRYVGVIVSQEKHKANWKGFARDDVENWEVRSVLINLTSYAPFESLVSAQLL